MVTEQEVTASLDAILVPGIKRSLVGLNLVREIAIAGGTVKVSLSAAALDTGVQDWIKAKATDIVAKVPGVSVVEVSFSEAKPKELNKITHVIAVMSGKGGVGKSLVAGLLAVSLRRQGYDVGILDADITGASIPRMFDIKARPSGSDNGLLPVLSRSGIELMSLNLLLPKEEDAVIWRGPLIGKAITQFWEEVLWGKLDYLIVDLPPGTADASLTVMQTIPISGVVIVFTPQNLVEMIVKKAVNMAWKMEKRILGMVENMSYLYVPEIDKKIEVFGKSRAEEMASEARTRLLGRIPIDPELAKLCDEGKIERYSSDIVTSLGVALFETAPAGKND